MGKLSDTEEEEYRDEYRKETLANIYSPVTMHKLDGEICITVREIGGGGGL